MSENVEQLVGIIFRTLAEEGYTEAQTDLLDTYQSKSNTDREELVEDLFTEVVNSLDHHLETEQEVQVLVTAIEQLLHRFSSVIEAAPVTILAVNTNGQIELWNDGAERIFGWSESEIKQRSYPDVLADSLDDTEAHFAQLQEGNQLTGLETRHRHKDGSILDVRIWASPFHKRDEGFAGATFVISDITEQKQREQRLAVLNRVLRHNIRNDVGIIQGHLDLLAETGDEGTEQIQVMEDRLSNIVELSDAARHIERLRDESKGELTTIDLKRVIGERVNQLQREFGDAEIRTTVPESASVLACKLFPYAIDNILDNAVRHNNKDNPFVKITVSMGSTSACGQTTVSVADNGPGLPEFEQEVLTSGEETQLNHSSGLGLWLTRWIVRNSNGTLAVEQSAWNGTRIVIRLPTRTN
jgi:PAS domain S-box-containing protein